MMAPLELVLLGWGAYGTDWNIPEVLSASAIQAGARVLYVEKPRMHAGVNAGRVEQLDERMWVLRNPVRFPNRLLRFEMAQQALGRLLAPKVQATARALGFERPVALLSSSHLGPRRVLDQLSHWRRIGFALDWWMSPMAKEIEIRMIEQCDLVLTISDCVYDRYRQRWPAKVVRLPYACDYRPYSNGRPAPAEILQAIPRPRLGYLGAMGPRVKRELLLELARRNPAWSFVLVGNHPPPNPGLAGDVELRRQPNVFLIGNQPREALPGVVSGFDVGLLPYVLEDEQVFHCTPQKVWEYFAVGIPVVSTPILELRKFADCVGFGVTAVEFERSIVSALSESSEDPVRALRRSHAQAVSLEAIGRKLVEITS